MLVAARPVLDNNHMGPSAGMLLMGRYLTDAEVDRLADLLQLPLYVHRVGDDSAPAGLATVEADLIKPGAVPEVRVLSADLIAGYTPLRDITGTTIGVAHIALPRAIHKQGQASIGYLIVGILLAGLAFGVATIWFVERSVLRRLADLTGEITGSPAAVTCCCG